MSHYGNYKPDFFKTDEKAHNLRFKRFWAKIYRNIIPALKRLCMGIILALAVISCRPQQTIIKEETVTRYIDSTIWHTDTTYYQLPIELYSDYTGLLDTLRLENTYSYTWSAVDTNKMILVGELRTKDVKIQVQYLWKDHIIYQDSIVEIVKEIPVPVEVIKTKTPKWAWITLILTLITLISIGWSVYRRLRP